MYVSIHARLMYESKYIYIYVYIYSPNKALAEEGFLLVFYRIDPVCQDFRKVPVVVSHRRLPA